MPEEIWQGRPEPPEEGDAISLGGDGAEDVDVPPLDAGAVPPEEHRVTLEHADGVRPRWRRPVVVVDDVR